MAAYRRAEVNISGGAVRARVVDDDQLVRGTRLREHRVEAGSECRLFVPGTDDDAESGRGLSVRWHATSEKHACTA